MAASCIQSATKTMYQYYVTEKYLYNLTKNKNKKYFFFNLKKEANKKDLIYSRLVLLKGITFIFVDWILYLQWQYSFFFAHNILVLHMFYYR